MRQIGVAVVGCGVNHARVYAGLDKAKLIKIADTDPERRRLAEKRFDDVRAALGLDQLDAFISHHKRIAHEYDRVLGMLKCAAPQHVEPPVESCFNYYTVKLDLEKVRCGRDRFVEALRAENIECGVYYPSPLTRHPMLGDGSTCTNAEELSRSVLSLPIHPFLDKREIEAVAEALGKVVSHFLR